MESGKLEELRHIARGIAAQFGPNCEVVVHDLSQHPDHTIVAIENGHVSGRKVGDGASNVVLERMEHQDQEAQDHLSYLTRTPDGKVLKSSTIYIRNSRGKVTAILAINFDISALMMAAGAVRDFISVQEPQPAEPEKIVNINDVLEELIQQLDVVGDSLIESTGLLRLVFPCDAEQVQGVYIPQSHIFQLALDLFGNGFRMLHLGDGGDHDAVFLRLFQIVFQTLLVDSQINHVLCPPVDLSR